VTEHVVFDRAAHWARACELTRRGLTLREIARTLGVPWASVELWVTIHEDFAAAMREAAAEYQDSVRASRRKRRPSAQAPARGGGINVSTGEKTNYG